MKTLVNPIGSTLVVAALLAVASRAQAQFIPGNLVIARVGDGTQTLANTGNSVFLDQFTTGGSLVNTLPIPDSGAASLIWSGTATSEGALTRSADGTLLTIAGYNTARPFGSSLTASSSAVVPRGLGVINAAGTYSLAVTTTTNFSANNVRAGITDGANNFWAAGANSGTPYLGTASGAASVQTNIGNTRVLGFESGNLFFSTSSGTRGIYGFQGGGAPTAGATTNLVIATGQTSSPYDFDFNVSMTIAYVADDTAGAAGGIQRWDFNGSSWGLSYTLGTGVANVGTRGLAVDFSGANPVIFATTAEGSANRLVALVDTGAGATATTLATAPAGQLFRGLDFAPVAVPEPTTYALVLVGGAAMFVLRRARRA